MGRIESIDEADTINFDENHYISTKIFRNFEGRNLFLEGINYIKENSTAFYFLKMVAEGYFFNRSKEPPNYRAENSPFKKTNLIGYTPTAFESWSNRELEESEKNLDYIFVGEKSERSDVFRKVRQHFVNDLYELKAFGGLEVG